MSIESIIASLIKGESAAVVELRRRIARVANTDLPVLIEGPTGAGKELVAQALHIASGRPGKFVAFNVCAIADSMFEDALFGHVRGAFTGAVSDSPGYLAEADAGTAFFDEVSLMAPSAQAKLLRVLETRVFRAVGGRRDTASDFRLISATNVELAILVRDGRFRADLGYRLAAWVIRVPSLAERRDDVVPLALHFLRESGRGDVHLDSGAQRALEAHDWPGNVRELRHVVACAVALSSSARLHREDFADLLADSVPPAVPRMHELTRRRLLRVLEECGWDVVAAANALGVHRGTVYRRIRRFRLSEQFTASAGHPVADADAPARPPGRWTASDPLAG